MFNIQITDELGEHLLNSERDCIFKCSDCGEERDIKDTDIINGKLINPSCSKCNKQMEFNYWLDSVYTDKEYKELLKAHGKEDK
jgi:DNA-directed RNA polymerase subunit RPC12/RpoP